MTSKLVDKIKEYLNEARRYLKLKKLAARESGRFRCPRPIPSTKRWRLSSTGALPVIISVEKAKDIELALKVRPGAETQGHFRGCAQGFKVAG